MAYKANHPDRQRVAGPRFSRLLIIAFLTAAGIGLGIGLIWVIAGLLNFHPLR
jgi:hypothetical protein